MTVHALLPSPFGWCAIPAGRVILEDEPNVFDVPAFDLAMYPVTNAQFQVFADAADGYAYLRWWDFSPRAQRWRAGNSLEETTFPGDDLPRVRLSWYEAVAFCHWLSAQSGEAIILPTELEWQRAAQGDDGRLYPWGSDFEADRCNTGEGKIKRLTPVTAYAHGASPYGVIDMSGNVSEWCLNGAYGPDEPDITGGEARAVRGGSYGLSQFSAQTTFRAFVHPGDRVDFVSFRLARHSA